MCFVVQLIQLLGEMVNTLVLDNNAIGDGGCRLLLDAVADLKRYRSISLVSIGLSPEGIVEFIAPFAESKLEELNLGSNPAAEKRNRFNEESC